jgi:coenzyme F420-dependent oxidoreductase
MSLTYDLAVPTAQLDDTASVVDFGVRAESLGYERLWVSENWGRDCVSQVAGIAARTTDVGLGTSIMNVYSRTPALVGQTAATLQELSGGRFRLGLGPSGPAVVEQWHGVEYERPLRRTREYVDVVRQALSDERVEYAGEFFELSRFALRFEAPDPSPPVDVSAMGPKAVELAGRFADGWHPLVLSPDGIEDRLTDLKRGLDLSDRSLDDVRVTASVPCLALDDAERARTLTAQHIAFYVGAMGDFYHRTVAEQGYASVADDVAEAWGEGEYGQAADVVESELLDEFGAAGTVSDVRSALESFDVEGVDAVTLRFPGRASVEEIESAAEALAPER